eukprot:GHVS01064676.1.p1 GENE.GHVS01064676.1~~GHVS01064676.1.p1  ORF type:complete len:374 (-),score=82.63 GHVS01064676.1:1824-2945(-)
MNGESSSGGGGGGLLPDVDFTRMEELRKMISPLSKEQLLDVVCRAAAAHTDVYETAHQIANESPASRRLMVRNIAFCTTNEALYSKFSTFGDIEDYTIVREKDTNKSKGFGFVTFKRAESVQAALNLSVLVDGRQLAVKLAADPVEDASADSLDAKFRRKLFIRNLSDNSTTQSLRDFFEHFGPLEDAVVVKTSDGNSKGFGFVTFQRSEDGVRAVQQPQRIIDGRMAFVSFASPSSGHKNVVGSHPGLGSAMGGGSGGFYGAGGGGFQRGGQGGFQSGQVQNSQGFANKRGGSDSMAFFRQISAAPPGAQQFVGMGPPGQVGGGGGGGGQNVASFVDQNQYLQQLQAMHAMQLGMSPQFPPQYGTQGGPTRF